MRREEWLLALLGVPDDRGQVPDRLDRVRVQKALFVVEMELDPKPFYHFTPYHYGPFCSDVYSDAEALSASGLVEEIEEDGGRYTSYRATQTGEQQALAIAEKMKPEPLSFLRRVRAWVLAHSFNSLVRAVYKRWPDMRAVSKFTE